MMGRSHLITGACALEHTYVAKTLIEQANVPALTFVWQGIESYLDIGGLTAVTLPVCLAAYFIGTLLPDIDNPKSILGRMIHIPVEHRTWLHAIYLYLIIGALRWLYPLLSWGFAALEGLHPYLAACHPVFAVILAVFKWLCPLSAWVFFGSIIHLLWDSVSACGNCWFYKLLSDYREYPGGAKIKKGHWLKLYHAGAWSEYMWLFLDVAVTVGSFVWITK